MANSIAIAAAAFGVSEADIRAVLNGTPGYTRRALKGDKKMRIAAIAPNKKEGGIVVRINEAFAHGKPMSEKKVEEFIGDSPTADNAAKAVLLVNQWHALAIANDGWTRLPDTGYSLGAKSAVVVPAAPVAETPAEPETPVEPGEPVKIEEPVVPPVEEPKVEEKELVAAGSVEEPKEDKKRGRKLA